MSRRLLRICMIICLGALVLAAAACGGSSKPDSVVTTLAPGTGVSGSPVPGASGSGVAPTSAGSPGATTTISPSGTPGAGQGGGTAVTDASIRADLLSRLAKSPALTGVELKVTVRKRVVIITGTVTQKAQKKAAEQIAVTEPYITKVISAIIVQPVGSGGY